MTDLDVERSQTTILPTHIILLILLLLFLIEEIVDSLSWGSHSAHRDNLLKDSVAPTTSNVDDSVIQLRIVLLVFVFKDFVDNLAVVDFLHVVDLPSIVRATIVHSRLIAVNYVLNTVAPVTMICMDLRHTDYCGHMAEKQHFTFFSDSDLS